MKNFKLFLLMVGTVLFFSSCGPTLKVSTDFDRAVNFSKYKTFGIYNLRIEDQTISDLNKNRIYSSIKKAMTAQGLTESNNPDIWINSVAVVDSKESHSSTTSMSGMGMNGMGMHGMGMHGMGMNGWGMGGMHRPYMWGGGGMMMMGGGFSHTQHHVDIIRTGSLVIDIIDANTNSLVWNTIGSRKINDNFGKNADEKILKYVSQLLSGFPPVNIVHIEATVE
jgi:hypothetical protein